MEPFPCDSKKNSKRINVLCLCICSICVVLAVAYDNTHVQHAVSQIKIDWLINVRIHKVPPAMLTERAESDKISCLTWHLHILLSLIYFLTIKNTIRCRTLLGSLAFWRENRCYSAIYRVQLVARGSAIACSNGVVNFRRNWLRVSATVQFRFIYIIPTKWLAFIFFSLVCLVWPSI